MEKRSKNLKEGKFIPLTFDLMFKKVFGNEEDKRPIKYLLKCILDIEVADVEILNQEIIGEVFGDKTPTVDLIVKLNDGTKVGIEMNTNVNTQLLNRNLFYMFRIMGRDLKKGESYNKLNKHIQINFDCEGYHRSPISRYRLIEDNDLEDVLTNILTIYRIDIPYYVNKCYNEDVKKLNNKEKFIGLIGIDDKEKTSEIVRGDNDMEDIYNKVEEFNGFEDIIGAYDGEWHRQEVMRTVMEEKIEKATKKATEQAIEQGIEQGIQQGMEKGSIQEKENIARNMLKEGIDINIISKVTGLTLEQINNLK